MISSIVCLGWMLSAVSVVSDGVDSAVLFWGVCDGAQEASAREMMVARMAGMGLKAPRNNFLSVLEC